MKARTCLAIVLAAGEGTRMRSAVPKVLHAIAGRQLIAHVLAAIAEAGITDTAVVIGPGQEAVTAAARRVLPHAAAFVQHEQRGTAHAALAAKAAITRLEADDVLIVYGATPLVRPVTLTRRRAPCSDSALPTRSATAGSLSPTASSSLSARKPMQAPASARSISATAG